MELGQVLFFLMLGHGMSVAESCSISIRTTRRKLKLEHQPSVGAHEQLQGWGA